MCSKEGGSRGFGENFVLILEVCVFFCWLILSCVVGMADLQEHRKQKLIMDGIRGLERNHSTIADRVQVGGSSLLRAVIGWLCCSLSHTHGVV